MRRIAALAAIVVAATAFVPARAERFTSSYMSFDMPPGWSCKLEEVVFECTPRDPVASQEVVVILTAKMVGPDDTLGQFEDQLARPKHPLSSVIEIKREEISGQIWIVSTHLESELTNYYTRYFATADDKIAMLLTFSAHKDNFDHWEAVLKPALSSIEIRAPR